MSACSDAPEDLVKMNLRPAAQWILDVLPVEDQDAHGGRYLRPTTPMEMPENSGRGVAPAIVRTRVRNDVRNG